MKKVSPSVYQLSLGAVNAFIIESNGLTLVDTGYPDGQEKIFRALKKVGKNPDDIRQIILTHAHPDHSGSAAALSTTLKIPVYAHQEDALLLQRGLTGRLPSTRSPGLLNWLIFNTFIKRSPTSVDAVTVDEYLCDQDVLPIAGGIVVIHTPGHSLGHISLLVQNEGILIAGDICANIMGPALSTVYEDRAVGIRSIQKAAALDFDKAVFGHGNPLTANANARLQATFGKAV